MAAGTAGQQAWIERVLGVTFPADAAPPRGQGAPATRISPRVAFLQSRILWANARSQAQADLQKLEHVLLAECEDEPDYGTIASNVGVLYTVLDYLDERLIDKLDDALNADGSQRIALQNEAREIIDEYVDYLNADELLRDIDDNGFLDLQVKATMTQQLGLISRNLKALAA